MSSLVDGNQLESLTTKSRLASVDFLRFLASFGIVWGHGLSVARPDFAKVGYAALALFCILMAYYSVKAVGGPRGPQSDGPAPDKVSRWLFQRRIGRVAIPWLFWCGFYLVLEAVFFSDLRSVLVIEDPFSLLVGPVIHLWFLPFAFIATGLFLGPSRFLDTKRRVMAACLAAVPLAAGLFWLHDGALLPEPFLQWAFAAPCFLFGLFVALGERHRAEIYAWAFFLSVCLVFLMLHPASWPIYLVLAALVFGAARLIVLPSGPAMKALGGLAMGIYLIHPFHMAVVYKFAGPGLDPVLSVLCVFVLSALSVWGMQHLPVLRHVV